MTLFRSSVQRKSHAWRRLDHLMCGPVGEAGEQPRYAKVRRLRLATSLDANGKQPAAAPDEPHCAAGKETSAGSWWQTGFPSWTTL